MINFNTNFFFPLFNMAREENESPALEMQQNDTKCEINTNKL